MTIEQIPASEKNYWKGRDEPIIALCCHQTGGVAIQSTINWFQNPTAQVSSHYVIGQDGRCVQMVQLADRAWAQGISFTALLVYKDQMCQIVKDKWGDNPNNYMASIEFVGVGGDITEAQYNAGSNIIKLLGIVIDRYHIVGHFEVNPKSKSGDASKIDYDKLISLAKGDPMPTFDYELYKKDNMLFMHVTVGSISEKCLVENLTKGTSWQVMCIKTPANDGGTLNSDMEKCLYQVTAKGVVHQYDNRDPIDPCAIEKAEIFRLQKQLDEIQKILDGHVASQAILYDEIKDLNRQNSELQGVQDENKILKGNIDALGTKITSLNTVIQDLKDMLVVRDTTIAGLINDKNKVEADLEVYTGQMEGDTTLFGRIVNALVKIYNERRSGNKTTNTTAG